MDDKFTPDSMNFENGQSNENNSDNTNVNTGKENTFTADKPQENTYSQPNLHQQTQNYQQPENSYYNRFQQNTRENDFGGTVSYSSNPDIKNNFQPPKKKKSGAGIVILCIILAIALCSGAFLAGRYLGNDNGSGKDTSNSTEVPSQNNSQPVTEEETQSEETLAYNNTVVEGSPLTEVVAKTVDSVVEIKTESVVYGSYYGQSVAQGAGSGVIVTADGFIVTNNHVIDGAEKVTVVLRNGQEYDAKIWGINTKNDLAVVKIEAKDLPIATFGNSDNLKVGENVIAIGNPLGELGGSVTSGIVSSLAREIKVDGKMMTLIQTDAPVNPGNSGGGLFNMAGELVGVVNAKSSGEDVEGIGFAIPSNTARDIVQNIIANKSSTDKAYLGVEVGQTRYGYVYISKVVEGFDAAAAGLQINDIFISVDGTVITSPSTLSSLIASYCVGDTAEFVIVRNNKQQIVTVTFTVPRPAEE